MKWKLKSQLDIFPKSIGVNYLNMRFFTTTLFLLCLLFSIETNAQILYGLQKSSPAASVFDLVSIDPFTGNSTVLFSTNDMNAVAANATTYDHANKRYISWGISTNNESKLYVADIDSGVVVSQPLLTGTPIEMEYDLKNQKAYGLWYDNAQSLQRFVEIDLVNGTLSTILTLPNVSAIALNHSTFDSNNGRYIFCGVENNQFKLITIDAVNALLVASVPFNAGGYGVSAMEYNVVNNKLYGITTVADSSMYDPINGYGLEMKLVEVDIITGGSTVVNQTPFNQGFWAGYMVGGISFDQQTQSYILVCVNDTSTYLRMIDVTTGIMYSSADLANANNGNFLEIQADHNTFAKSFYAGSVNTRNIFKTIEGKIFPNPTSDYLNIEVDAPIDYLEIFDLEGRRVVQENNMSNPQISLSNLISGTYLLVVHTKDGFYKSKFIKY